METNWSTRVCGLSTVNTSIVQFCEHSDFSLFWHHVWNAGYASNQVLTHTFASSMLKYPVLWWSLSRVYIQSSRSYFLVGGTYLSIMEQFPLHLPHKRLHLLSHDLVLSLTVHLEMFWLVGAGIMPHDNPQTLWHAIMIVDLAHTSLKMAGQAFSAVLSYPCLMWFQLSGKVGWARLGSAGWFSCRPQVCGLSQLNTFVSHSRWTRGTAEAYSSQGDGRDARSHVWLHHICLHPIDQRIHMAKPILKAWEKSINLPGKKSEFREARRDHRKS